MGGLIHTGGSICNRRLSQGGGAVGAGAPPGRESPPRGQQCTSRPSGRRELRFYYYLYRAGQGVVNLGIYGVFCVYTDD